ncbi:hypothetical protein ACFX15_034256 [Malus domestica]
MRSSTKANKQSMLMYIICAPIKTLTKTRNFYMRSVEDCAGRVGHGGGGVSGYTASQVPHVPRSFSINPSSSSNDEDVRQLLRTSTSNRNNSVEKYNKNKSASNSDMHRRPIAQPIVRQPKNTMNGMGVRGYSVGLTMGRIDEETACSFREDEANEKIDLYPRRRSYAVEKNCRACINCEGYIIGNPATNVKGDVNSRIEYAHRMALISDRIYEVCISLLVLFQELSFKVPL